jgi:hypothetical protein
VLENVALAQQQHKKAHEHETACLSSLYTKHWLAVLDSQYLPSLMCFEGALHACLVCVCGFTAIKIELAYALLAALVACTPTPMLILLASGRIKPMPVAVQTQNFHEVSNAEGASLRVYE